MTTTSPAIASAAGGNEGSPGAALDARRRQEPWEGVILYRINPEGGRLIFCRLKACVPAEPNTM